LKGLKKKKLGTPPAWVLHKFRVLPLEADTIGEALKLLRDLTGGDVDLGKGVLMMAAHLLERSQDADPKRLPRPIYKIVIHTTPSLDEAHIETDKGPVPISAKELELAMGSAEVVELDKAIKEAEEALNKEAPQEGDGDEEATDEAVEPDEEMGEELEKAEEAKSEEAREKPKDEEGVPEEADKGAHVGTPSTSGEAAGGAHVGAPATPAEAVDGAHVGTPSTSADAGDGAHVGTASPGVGSDHAPPTSPRLRRHILERDHGHCSVPGCRCRIGLPVHHVVPRGLGGKTEASNLATLCIYHHSLVTDGLLIIEGRAPDKLVFKREDGSLFHPELLSPEQKLALEIPSSPPPPKEEPFKIPAVITADWWQANKHHFRWSDRKDCYEVV